MGPTAEALYDSKAPRGCLADSPGKRGEVHPSWLGPVLPRGSHPIKRPALYQGKHIGIDA